MGLIYLELCTVYRWLNGLTHNEAQHRGLLPEMLPPQQTNKNNCKLSNINSPPFHQIPSINTSNIQPQITTNPVILQILVMIGTQIVSLGGQSQASTRMASRLFSCDWHSNCIFRWSITGQPPELLVLKCCDWHSNCIFRWSITGSRRGAITEK